jgi:glycosyltransferase involved in cell wall biosynthesis
MESGLSIAVPARLLTIHKGQDMIIEIMRKPKWRKANITINLYGEGPDEDSLQKTIDNYGVTNVRMNGKVKNMVDIWRKNHAILLASRMEGLPIVLVGAMICARTPILTNVGGHAEVVDDNINGFIANDCSVLSLEDALERAYSKRHELEKMGLLARQKALDYLPDDTTQHFIDKIIKVMETL